MSKWFISGDLRPKATFQIFFFPHGGGNTSSFSDIIKSLPDEFEPIILSLPGRGKRFDEPLVDNLSVLVDDLVEDFCLHYAKKPYVLFGHSVGAIIAFEFANRMKKEGNTNLLLRIFLSGHLPPNVGEVTYHDLPKEEMVQIMRDGKIIDFQEEGISLSNEWIDFILPQMRSDFRLSETYTIEYDSFEPLSIPASVCSGKDDELIQSSEISRWDELFTPEVEYEYFNGDHFYYRSDLERVIKYISRKCQSDLSKYPLSIMKGENMEYEDISLHEHFRNQVRSTPQSVAIVGLDEDTGKEKKSVTYEKVDALSDLLGRYLLKFGVAKGDLVAVYMEKSIDYVIGFISVWKTGAGVLVLEDHPDENFKNILKVTRPKFILTKSYHVEKLERISGGCDWMRSSKRNENGTIWLDMSDSWIEDLSKKEYLLSDLSTLNQVKSDPMYVAFSVTTSGTTGMPKAVIGTHRMLSFSHQYRNREFPPSENDREGYNIFFNWEFIRPLMFGEVLYIIPEQIIRDPHSLNRCIQDNEFTRIMTTPTLLDKIISVVDHGNQEGQEVCNSSSWMKGLSLVWVNGEVLPTETWKEFSRINRNAELVNLYSISECFDISNVRCSEMDTRLSPKFSSVGRPISNVRIYVLDENHLPVPKGVEGEVYVAGVNLSYGYLRNPEKTKQCFLVDSVMNKTSDVNEKMYKTGDVGRILSNGQLEIRGRTDFMVKVRGFRIQLEQVQTALLENDDVAAASIIPYRNEKGVNEFLIAYVVPSNSFMGNTKDEITVEMKKSLKIKLIGFLRKKIPHFAVPSYYIILSEFPVSPITGKLDKRKLPRFEIPSVKKKKNTRMESSGVSLENIIAKLKTIWKNILYDIDSLNDDDNFFMLGGHSMLAVSLVQEIKKGFGDIEISVADIYSQPTIQKVSEIIHERVSHVVKKSKSARSIFSMLGRNEEDDEVAVIGLSCVFPGATNAGEFFKNICEAKCSISGSSAKKDDGENYVNVCAKLPIDETEFDYRFWGISAREARDIDPQHRIFLRHCFKSLEHAGYSPLSLSDDIRLGTGVFGGCYFSSYLLSKIRSKENETPEIYLDESNVVDMYLKELGNDKDYITTRVSYLLNLGGPSVNVQTSCSTSLVAIAMACQAIRSGQCRLALAGGVKISSPPNEGYFYSPGHVLSKTGQCRPFDKSANGTIFTDGCGVVVLKSLKRAREDGDTILAVVKGWAVNNDGRDGKISYSSPSIEGQRRVVRESLVQARVSPDSLGLIEAHGTGTYVGDPVEVEALRKVFEEDFSLKSRSDHTCYLGSVKGNIGHADIAAGVAGFIKTVFCLKNNKIPPIAGLEVPNPDLKMGNGLFALPKGLTEWKRSSDHPRRAGVSCFGIGGTNCHVTLEEFNHHQPQTNEEKDKSDPPERIIIPISAKSNWSLGTLKEEYVKLFEEIQEKGDSSFDDDGDDVSLHVQRLQDLLFEKKDQFALRISVTSEPDPTKIAMKLRNLQIAKKPNEKKKKEIIFLFTGQGHQYDLMGLELYKSNKRFREEMDRCFSVFEDVYEDRTIKKRFLSSSQDPKLQEEDEFEDGRLQAILFSVEYSLSRILMKAGIEPNFIIGHSFGEYVAASISGIMTLETVAKFVHSRAKFLREFEMIGSMISLPLHHERVLELIKKFGMTHEIFISLVNCEQQTCVSGEFEPIERFQKLVEETFKEESIKIKKVKVDHPFHCPLLKPVSDTLREKFTVGSSKDVLKSPNIPIYSNVTGRSLRSEECRDFSYWCDLVSKKCNFLSIMESLKENVFSKSKDTSYVLLEFGPGRFMTSVLRNFISNHSSDFDSNGFIYCPTLPSRNQKSEYQRSDVGVFMETISRVWTSLPHITLKWNELFSVVGKGNHLEISLPSYPFERLTCRYKNSMSRKIGSKEEEDERYKPEKRKFELMDIKDRFYVSSWKPLRRRVTTRKLRKERKEENELLIVIFSQFSVGFVKSTLSMMRRSSSRAENLFAKNVFLLPIGELANDVSREFGTYESVTFVSNPERICSKIEEQCSIKNDFPKTIRILSCDVKDCEITSFHTFFRGEYLLRCVRQILEKMSCKIHVSCLICDDDDRGKMEKSSLLIGPLLVLPQEYPKRCDCSIMFYSSDDLRGEMKSTNYDLPSGHMVLEEVFYPEFGHDQSFREVKFVTRVKAKNKKSTIRFIPSFDQYPLDEDDDVSDVGNCTMNSVFLVIGGLGRIGRTLCSHLLEKYRPKKMYLTTTKRKEEVDSLLFRRFLDDERVKVIYEVKGERLEDIRRTLACVYSEKNRLEGIFYLAGRYKQIPLFDNMLDDDTQKKVDINETMNSKVIGIENLGSCLDADEPSHLDLGPPKFVIVFSSLASFLGGKGMSYYSSANRYLDMYVRNRVQKEYEMKTRWISVNWDDWDYEYESEEVVGEYNGLLSLSPSDGMKCVDRILQTFFSNDEEGCCEEYFDPESIPSRIIVSNTNLQTRVSIWVTRKNIRFQQQQQHDNSNNKKRKEKKKKNTRETNCEEEEVEGEGEDGEDDFRILHSNGAKREARKLRKSRTIDDLERELLRTYEDVLGSEEIGLDGNFFAFGGESILAAIIINRIRKLVSSNGKWKLRRTKETPKRGSGRLGNQMDQEDGKGTEKFVSLLNIYEYPSVRSLAKYLFDKMKKFGDRE